MDEKTAEFIGREHLHIVVVKHDGMWYAEALEMRLYAQGETWKEAKHKLLASVTSALESTAPREDLWKESASQISHRWGSVSDSGFTWIRDYVEGLTLLCKVGSWRDRLHGDGYIPPPLRGDLGYQIEPDMRNSRQETDGSTDRGKEYGETLNTGQRRSP